MFQIESQPRETFDFKVGDAGPFSVTSYRRVPLDVAMRLGVAQKDRDGFAVSKEICDFFEAEAPGCTRALDLGGFRQLMAAWVADSGMAEGESGPSSE